MPTSDSTVIIGQYKGAAHAPPGTNAYRGHRIHALPGLHDFLAALIKQHVRTGSSILDLAAGSGAMSMRLRDLGHVPHAVDFVAENFKPADIPFTQLKLNDAFGKTVGKGRFDAILASEIIEHLENPRHFLRQCHEALADDGFLILSTPNLHNSGSTASFLRTGQFLWFSDLDYQVQGHITPLTPWQIGHCLAEAGYRTVWSGSFGTGSSKLAGSPRLKILARLVDALSAVPKALRGEVYACLAQKVSASPPHAGGSPPPGTG